MKVIFVGPSLPDAKAIAGNATLVRPPACQGDVFRALEDGATAIGLVDGQFEFVAPVWHKELLFALSRGVPVYGAASMGALRAAECEAYGMIGVGRIFDDYVSGNREDDADVALLHGPAEMGYPALSLPMVNVDATLNKGLREGICSQDMALQISQAARRVFFKERTWRRIAQTASTDRAQVAALVAKAWTDQKRLDAIELLFKIEQEPLNRPSVDWTFNATPIWRELFPDYLCM